MKNGNRILALLLCLCLTAMLVSTAGLAAFAEEHDHSFEYDPMSFYDEDGHVLYCAGCGTGYVEAHTYGDTPVCQVCGYMDHQHTVSADKRFPLMPEGHVISCAECGMMRFMKHSLNGYGQCTVCGYYDHTHDWVWSQEPEDLDADGHYMQCSICLNHEYFAHDLDASNRCTVCDYYDHNHTYAVDNASPVEEGTHTLRCLSCDMVLKEEHSFDENSRCAVCGYVLSGLGRPYAVYDGVDFYKDADGETRAFASGIGAPVVNRFVTDGTRLYFFDAVGVAVRDRMLWDTTGTQLLYANSRGYLENTGWFHFSGKEFSNDDGFVGTAGGLGFAGADGLLRINTQLPGPDGTQLQFQGDGHTVPVETVEETLPEEPVDLLPAEEAEPSFLKAEDTTSFDVDPS